MKKIDYRYEDIVNALKKVDLKKGDNIFIHSNLGFFGKSNVSTSEEYCTNFKNAILEVIGEEGTLVVPTFSYSYCNKEIFDKNNTKSVTGIFSEYVRTDKNSVRSDDPNFSVSAIGKNAKYFTDDVNVNPFGENSFCERFLNKDGKICNFNLDSASTFVHFVERELKVPYRYDKEFPGISIIDGKEIKGNYYHFVYDLAKPEDSPDFSKFDKKAHEKKLVKFADLGKGRITCISTSNIMNLIKDEIKKDKNFLINRKG